MWYNIFLHTIWIGIDTKFETKNILNILFDLWIERNGILRNRGCVGCTLIQLNIPNS